MKKKQENLQHRQKQKKNIYTQTFCCKGKKVHGVKNTILDECLNVGFLNDSGLGYTSTKGSGRTCKSADSRKGHDAVQLYAKKAKEEAGKRKGLSCFIVTIDWDRVCIISRNNRLYCYPACVYRGVTSLKHMYNMYIYTCIRRINKRRRYTGCKCIYLVCH